MHFRLKAMKVWILGYIFYMRFMVTSITTHMAVGICHLDSHQTEPQEFPGIREAGNFQQEWVSADTGRYTILAGSLKGSGRR